MAEYQFGRLSIAPVRNPAVLDTATWDPKAARELMRSNETLTEISAAWRLARLGDGQRVLIETSSGGPVPGEPLGELALPEGGRLRVFPADAATVEWVVLNHAPGKGPRALGAIPRLGIGDRMSTSIWPGVWPALVRAKLAANAIQNSVRELNLLEDLRAGRPAQSNYMFGFGTLYEGHTGSTFEGLWLAGVLAALESAQEVRFGADADHIMVKRTPDGLDRARRVIAAARRYTFFTLDVSDILDYEAMSANRGGDVAARCAAKYNRALEAVENLADYIGSLKGKTPYDLELSIDETPPGVRALDYTTTADELAFLLAEIRRRRLPVTHIAPNFGVEKGSDYMGADGLPGLEQRVRSLHRLAVEQGIMLDCHSGDDLSSATRRTVGRAAGGNIHFKISPMLQALFADVLHALCPERFLYWWEDTMAYARHEAAQGSALAARCVRQFDESGQPPSPAHPLFHYYCFATLGRRDADGRFLHREKFYDLPESFYAEYARQVTDLLTEVTTDVFGI